MQTGKYEDLPEAKFHVRSGTCEFFTDDSPISDFEGCDLLRRDEITVGPHTGRECPSRSSPALRLCVASLATEIAPVGASCASGSIAEVWADPNAWMQSPDEDRPHRGRLCFGKAPIGTLLAAVPMALDKMIAA